MSDQSWKHREDCETFIRVRVRVGTDKKRKLNCVERQQFKKIRRLTTESDDVGISLAHFKEVISISGDTERLVRSVQRVWRLNKLYRRNLADGFDRNEARQMSKRHTHTVNKSVDLWKYKCTVLKGDILHVSS